MQRSERCLEDDPLALPFAQHRHRIEPGGTMGGMSGGLAGGIAGFSMPKFSQINENARKSVRKEG